MSPNNAPLTSEEPNLNVRIKGFDYNACAIVELTRPEWQERIAEAIKEGGFRRVMYGDTYVHACGGQLKAEIYTNVPAPPQGQVA
jgi:hypothetical protein